MPGWVAQYLLSGNVEKLTFAEQPYQFVVKAIHAYLTGRKEVLEPLMKKVQVRWFPMWVNAIRQALVKRNYQELMKLIPAKWPKVEDFSKLTEETK